MTPMMLVLLLTVLANSNPNKIPYCKKKKKKCPQFFCQYSQSQFSMNLRSQPVTNPHLASEMKKVIKHGGNKKTAIELAS